MSVREGLLTKNKSHTLREMLMTKNRLLEEIYNNYGEISDEQNTELEILDVKLPSKIDGWGFTLVNGGSIDKEIEQLQDRKKTIDEMIQVMKNSKDRLKKRAHDILNYYELDRIDGIHFWLKRDVRKTNQIQPELVEDEFKQYQLPKLSFTQYTILRGAIESLLNDRVDLTVEEKTSLNDLITKLENDTSTTCLLQNLPKEHTAITTELSPTIRVYKKKK